MYDINATVLYYSNTVITSHMNILEFSHGSVQLNDEQYRVVTSPPSENQRILASAGSGKTSTITARIAYLVQEYDIDPTKILLVSFSRSAAQEMIHRVHHLIGPVNMYAGTFHALAAQILRDRAPHLLRDQPFIDELPYRLMKWLESDMGSKWAKRFRTIIVDEFQDINEIQWQILKGFYHVTDACNAFDAYKRPSTTMSIVGDDAQNIYTWRGSSVSFLLDFDKNLGHSVKDYQLCQNYRSTEAIVTIANSVMRFIPTLPFKEKMVAYQKGGQKPHVHFFFRASDEYDWIVNSIEKLIKKAKQINDPKTFAVLSRYNSDLFKIEERLHKKGISYKLCTSYSPEEKTQKHTKKVTLATIHASKGLEWDIVFFMNLHDDVFPSGKSDEDIISERRLFYVGVTRAKRGLFLTYSRQERSLSRFVREIPRPFLIFHNVASFTLSTNPALEHVLSIEDMIRGFDGGDWNTLREQNDVPLIQDKRTESIYPFGKLFAMPDWVRELDVRETWLNMMKIIALRECNLDKLDTLRTPEINEALLTLRVYREDIAFWELYEAELEHLLHHFMKHTREMPALDYATLQEYIVTYLPHLQWPAADLCHALVILAKIRGQLRPMRHTGFDLREFSFGVVRNSVPTEMRPEVLGSWHRVIDKSRKTNEILPDLWRMAALSSVLEGRNIPLYQYEAVCPHLIKDEQQDMVKAMMKSFKPWIATLEHPTFHFIFEAPDIRPIRFDIMTEKCAYYLFFDPQFVPSNEDKILLLLKQYAYEEVFDRSLDSIGFLNMATGITLHYEVTSTTRAQLSHMGQHLQRKYVEAPAPPHPPHGGTST